MNSSLILLDVLTADQDIQQSRSDVFKSHKQQDVTEEADRLSEPNTVDELSWSKSICDRFSHSTSYISLRFTKNRAMSATCIQGLTFFELFIK
jgi:hypothetical protein